MKKIILFIVLVLIIQGGYKIKLVLAQQKTEIKEMSDVVQTFLESFAHGDIDSMMKQVSQNYSDKDKEGNIIDYAKFKPILEKKLDAFAKKYSNYSIVDSEFTGSKIEGNKDSIAVVFRWKRFNFDWLRLNYVSLGSVKLNRRGFGPGISKKGADYV